jgi:AcrR family transcriptional regulator
LYRLNMPQRSNRQRLIEGTLRCLERLPPERITARAIAAESGANLASIGYHFGSMDAGALVLSLFHGLLLQVLLDPDLAIYGDRMKRAQARLLRVLPGQTS